MFFTIAVKFLGKATPSYCVIILPNNDFDPVTLTDLRREDLLVIQLLLDPSHQKVYIFGGRDLQSLLHFDAISPVIFVSNNRVRIRTS
jgi:hypothetical protein